MAKIETHSHTKIVVMCNHEHDRTGSASCYTMADEQRASDEAERRNGLKRGGPDCLPWRAAKIITTTTVETVEIEPT